MPSSTRSSLLALALAFGSLIATFVGLSRQVSERPFQDVVLKRDSGQSDLDDEALPVFRLHRLPRTTLRPRAPMSKEQAQRIERCIAQLSEVDHPDYGYARTLRGVRFLPLLDQTDAFGWTVTNHELAISEALRELVEIGPAALPALLSHLKDTTPTRLQILPISHGPPEFGIRGGMSSSNELFGNPANPREAELRPIQWHRRSTESRDIDEHQLKIGDLCFVAIGQIVGRPYIAVRYQNTSCVVVNSPTLDQTLCDRVRQIWGGSNPERIVFESLLRDFCTEEVSDDPPRGLDDVLSGYQSDAAMRLLYYFPREAEGLVAHRLHQLRVAWPADEETDTTSLFVSADHPSSHIHRVKEFVKRVAWCPAETVRHEVRRIFQTTTSLDIALAALPAIAKESPDEARGRALSLIKGANGSFDLYDVVVALVQGYGRDVLAILPDVFREASPNKLQWFCLWGGDTMFDANDQLLGLLLTDQRLTVPDPKDVDNPKGKTIRVCDAAASALSERNSKFLFENTAPVDERDLQIERLREQLRAELPRPSSGNLQRDK